MTCEYCESESGVFDFTRVCCRARYVVGELKTDSKREWMDLWKRQLDPDEFKATVEEVKRQCQVST